MVSIKRVLEAVMRLVKRIECLGLVSANWTAPPGGVSSWRRIAQQTVFETSSIVYREKHVCFPKALRFRGPLTL